MTFTTWDATKIYTGQADFTNNNMTVKYSNGEQVTVIASSSKKTGKWYWEVTAEEVTNTLIGVVSKGVATGAKTYNSTQALYYQNGSRLYGTSTASYGTSYVKGDVIGVALDLDNGEISFYKNGVTQGVAFSGLNSFDEIVPAVTTNGGSSPNTLTVNFGVTPFKYSIPTGYFAFDHQFYNIFAIKSADKYFNFDSKTGTLTHLPNISVDTLIKYGTFKGWEVDLSAPLVEHKYVSYDSATNNYNETTVAENSMLSVYDYIGENFELVILSELNDDMVVETEIEPYSVYDHISENPQAIIYTESTGDITVSTTTEPYDLYDEFGNELEVLFYTDNEEVTEADLILEANWSPVDELEGDFEVVTWTDEPQDTAQRVLELKAIPKPQFVKLANPKRLYGYLDDVLAIDASSSYKDEVRYLFTDENATTWYVWDFNTKKFVEVDASTHELILKNGMKHTDVAQLTQDDWRTWDKDYINIGVFLKDNPRDTITSVVETISYEDYLPRDTVELEKANFYILNTTAKIDIELNGNVLKGLLSDDDLTRVQYRVLLNGGYYYPSDGSFTRLGESPQNIELVIGSKDVKIDDWNTIKIEFQDFFGTTDYWSTNFIGTYSGLMFKDVYGQYYSSEIGEILQYLDFGVIIAGQTTIEHEVILKNQYGYDVENIHIYANTSNFPTGLECEFSPTQTPFSSNPELRLSGVLKNNEEMSFFVRLKTVLGATPDANGSFDIIVRADRA